MRFSGVRSDARHVKIFDGRGNFIPTFRSASTPDLVDSVGSGHQRDGRLEAIIGTNNYRGTVKSSEIRFVRAFDTKSGREVWHTALGNRTRVFSSAAIGDVGNDGSLDVAFGTLQDPNYGEIFLLDAHTGRIRWRQEGGHRDVCACGFMGSPVIADVDGDGKSEVVATSQVGSIVHGRSRKS